MTITCERAADPHNLFQETRLVTAFCAAVEKDGMRWYDISHQRGVISAYSARPGLRTGVFVR